MKWLKISVGLLLVIRFLVGDADLFGFLLTDTHSHGIVAGVLDIVLFLAILVALFGFNWSTKSWLGVVSVVFAVEAINLTWHVVMLSSKEVTTAAVLCIVGFLVLAIAAGSYGYVQKLRHA